MTPSDQSYRTIALTQGQVTLVDDADYEFLSRWKWFAWWNRHTSSFYAVRSARLEDGTKVTVRMNRQILGLERGDKRQGDHRNHDTLDNRRENLRICTPSENSQNRRVQRNSKSGQKGVSYRASKRKWRAVIFVNGTHLHLGYRDTAEECIALYREAEQRYFGEFALHDGVSYAKSRTKESASA